MLSAKAGAGGRLLLFGGMEHWVVGGGRGEGCGLVGWGVVEMVLERGSFGRMVGEGLWFG